MPEKNRFHILVIEDDDGVRRNLMVGLKDAGFQVSCEVDGEAGVQRALHEEFDLVILDLMMPERTGFEVLEAWNGRLSIPVIILSARTELRSRLKSFELGAVDYVTKPFWMEELVARVFSRLRVRVDAPRRIIQWENVELNLDARRASIDGEDIGLTAHEYNVLAYLVERPGRAVSRRQLADFALPECGERYDRTVDSHVSRIRHKVGKEAAKRIATVWGVGYRFEES